jgi:hypothetical protein
LSPELEHIRCEVERLTLGWSESDWQRALPGKWTSAQILEHLRLTFTGTSKGILSVMEIGRPLGGKPTLPDRLRTFWVAKLGLMPSGRSAPKQTIPQDGFEGNSLRRFYDALVAVDATLADAERRSAAASNCSIILSLDPSAPKNGASFTAPTPSIT